MTTPALHQEMSNDIPAYNRTLITVILISGAFVSVLNQTLMLVAIAPIMRDFAISASQAQWVTTAFMLTSGLFIPVSAALIDKFSSRRLYLAALAIFLVGTVLGSLAGTFEVLLLARIIQGASAGIVMPLIQTVMMSIFPPQKRGTAMGMVGLVIAFAPAIGPALAGWIVDHLSWRYLFIILIPISLLVLTAALGFMKNVTRQRENRIDVASVVLSTFGWGGLLYGFSIAGAQGWGSPNVIISLATGGVTLTLFIRRQTRLAQPLLDVTVFTSRTFTLTTVLSVLVFALLIGAQTLIPIYAQTVRAMSALDAGLLLLPGAVVMGLMSPVAGKLYDRFGIRWLSIVGFSLLSVAMLMLANLNEHQHPLWIAAMSMLHMLGVATMMMPLITAGINALPRHLIAHATAMNNTVRMVGASIGTAILVTVMSATADGGAGAETPSAVARGVSHAFLLAFAVALAGLAIASRLGRGEVVAH